MPARAAAAGGAGAGEDARRGRPGGVPPERGGCPRGLPAGAARQPSEGVCRVVRGWPALERRARAQASSAAAPLGRPIRWKCRPPSWACLLRGLAGWLRTAAAAAAGPGPAPHSGRAVHHAPGLPTHGSQPVWRQRRQLLHAAGPPGQPAVGARRRGSLGLGPARGGRAGSSCCCRSGAARINASSPARPHPRWQRSCACLRCSRPSLPGRGQRQLRLPPPSPCRQRWAEQPAPLCSCNAEQPRPRGRPDSLPSSCLSWPQAPCGECVLPAIDAAELAFSSGPPLGSGTYGTVRASACWPLIVQTSPSPRPIPTTHHPCHLHVRPPSPSPSAQVFKVVWQGVHELAAKRVELGQFEAARQAFRKVRRRERPREQGLQGRSCAALRAHACSCCPPPPLRACRPPRPHPSLLHASRAPCTSPAGTNLRCRAVRRRRRRCSGG